MPRLLIRLALFALLACSVTRANVTINFDAGAFYDASGNPISADSLVVLLISDTTGNGFGSVRPGSLESGSFLDGVDDLILARAYVFEMSGNSRAQGALEDAAFYGNWNADDALALVWFSGLSDDATTLSAGTAYGYFSATIPQDDSAPWLTPTDGNTISLKFLNSAGSGTYNHELFRTNLTVSAVPEPATYAALAGLGALGLALWRRRKTC